jgi:hypothetical protein
MTYKLSSLILAIVLLIVGLPFDSFAQTHWQSEPLHIEPRQIQGTSNRVQADKMKNHTMIIDFKQPNEWTKWQVVNDGVMGGKSQGTITSIGNHGVFSGDISLENNGGFSSTLRPIKPLEQGFDHLLIDIEGDGLTYQLRAVVYINGYRLAYKHDFTTMKQKREQLRLPLANFKASFRGRIISDAPPLVSENIAEIGVLITNKRAGQFNLHIHSVAAYQD